MGVFGCEQVSINIVDIGWCSRQCRHAVGAEKMNRIAYYLAFSLVWLIGFILEVFGIDYLYDSKYISGLMLCVLGVVVVMLGEYLLSENTKQ